MKVETLLALRGARYREDDWHALTTGETWYCALKEAVRDGYTDWANLHVLAHRWQQEYLAYLDDAAMQKVQVGKWRTLCRMLWCANEAATQASFYQGGALDGVFLALSEVPDDIRRHQPWIWGCIRSLLNVPSHSVRVPIALELRGQTEGLLATLELDVLNDGAGVVIQHPKDAFSPVDIQETFRDSLVQAWEAAGELAAPNVNARRHDGLWRLLVDAAQAPSVAGSSVGGAAALGWYRALQEQVIDPRLVVLAQVKERNQVNDLHPNPENSRYQYQLTDVDGIEPKVKAIMADGQRDTIVVISAGTACQARKVPGLAAAGLRVIALEEESSPAAS